VTALKRRSHEYAPPIDGQARRPVLNGPAPASAIHSPPDNAPRRRRIFTASGLAVLLMAGTVLAQGEPPAPASSKDDLFRKVFGGRKKVDKPRRLDLPVRLEGRELGLVPAHLTGDPKAARLDMNVLADLLAEQAQEEPLAALRALAGPDGFGLATGAPPGGIGIQVNETDLAVEVVVPPSLRRKVSIDVLGRTNLLQGFLALPPASVSAYVNMRGAVEYLSLPDPDRPDGRGPVSVSFEHSLNILGWVAEAEGFYREDGTERWSRGPVRLIRDFTGSGIRLQAGDLFYPVRGPQIGQPLGGLSIARNFGLRPYDAVQPTGARDFVLEAPSVVEVFINGQPTRTLRLAPGPYSLSNFPGTSGANDIQIRITDLYGRTEVIEFPFFFDSQLLMPGLSDFAYTLGVPYVTARDRFQYDRHRLVFSGYHRLGMTDWLTLGAGLQMDRRQQVASAEALVATSLGTFGLEPVLSVAGVTGTGVTLRYRDYRTGEQIWEQRTVTAQLGWRDSALTSFGTPDPRNDVSVDAAIRVSQPLMANLTASLGARWQESRTPTRADTYSVDLALRRRLGRTGSMDLTLSHDRESDGRLNTGAYLSLRYSFDDGRQSAGASIDTVGRERRLDWRYQSLQPVDQLSLSLDATDRAGPDRLQGSAAYTHQRFLISVRHDLSERLLGDATSRENRTQINLATALAFADGHAALSRPISNSFAIVTPHPRLKGKPIGVDPVNGHYLAQSDLLGPPVIPNISAYLVRPLLLDVPDVPPGYDLGNDRPAVQPGYRTGTLIPIGTDATVSLDGLLIGPDGQALSLMSGILRPMDAPGRKDLSFFTNRKGRFRVEAVAPGRWELHIHGMEARPVPVEVPADAEGVVHLGETRLVPP